MHCDYFFSLAEYATAEEHKDLFNELVLMTGISRHPNLVNLIGACTTNGKYNEYQDCAK